MGIRNGSSVSLSYDGNTIAIGEPYADEVGTDSGRTRIYQYNNYNININNLIKDILLNIPTINISNYIKYWIKYEIHYLDIKCK